MRGIEMQSALGFGAHVGAPWQLLAFCVLGAGLAALPGVSTYPSDANMVLVRLAPRAGADGDVATTVFQHMKDRGVLVKNMAGFHPLLANCLRLTVGTAEENQTMLAALKDALCQTPQ